MSDQGGGFTRILSAIARAAHFVAACGLGRVSAWVKEKVTCGDCANPQDLENVLADR